MQRPLRVLAAPALLLLFAIAAQAGTQTAPEVTDPAQDQLGPGGTPGCAQGQCPIAGTRVDIVAAWIDNETATSFQIHIQTTGVPPSTHGLNYSASFASGGTTYTASMSITCNVNAATPCNAGITNSGVAAAAAIEATGVVMTVNKDAIGSPAAGTALSQLTIAATAYLATTTNVAGTDAAGPGTDYTLLSGPGGGTPGDVDADGLDDTWEQTHFSGTSAQNSTGDPDGDQCNNKCEFDHQTDPNDADTDGDGYPDGQEIAAQKDPTDPSSNPGGTTTTGGPPPGTTTGGPPPGSTTGPGGDGNGGTDGAGGDDDASTRLQDGFKEGLLGFGYLILASALALVVVILSIIGRAGRWRL